MEGDTIRGLEFKFAIRRRRSSIAVGHWFGYALITGLTLLLAACQSFIDSTITDDFTNPENPYFIDPGVTFQANFTPGDTIYTNTPAISWSGSVFDSCEFRWTVDSVMFGDWSQDSSVTLPTLDEGWHLLEIRTRYVNGVEAEWNDSLTFVVDAIGGPALRLSPPYQEQFFGDEVTFDLMLEEVANWSGGRLTLAWDSDRAQIMSYLVFADTYDFLSQNNSQIVTDFDVYPDSLVLEVGLIDDFRYGISGSGAIARVRFQKRTAADTLQVHYGACQFRNAANQTIPILARVPGTGVFREPFNE